MRFRIFVLAALLAGVGAGGVPAQNASSVGILPTDKRGAEIPATERNPFAKKVEPKPEVQIAEVDTESEESRIRAVLEDLEVVGRTRGPDGWKVLLGDLILQDGTTLPPVIPNQTQTLRVVAVFATLVEIEWTETAAEGPPRRIFIPINLQPGVNIAVSGTSYAEDSDEAPAIVTRPIPPSLPDAPAE